MGDRTATKDPTSIVLPQQKTWRWETKTTSSNTSALETYYAEDPIQRGRLWALDPAKAAGWMAVKAPLLLAVLLVLFRAIWDEKKPLMPHEIRGLAIQLSTR